MSVEIGQIITQIISFLIMLWVLKRYAWKPLLAVLDARREKIQGEFDTIENGKKENENLKKEYEKKLREIDVQARAKIQEAVAEGNELSMEIQNAAHAKAQEIVSRAKEELQKEVYKARTKLKDELVDMTLSATEKVVQLNLNKDNQKKLINDFIEQMENH